MSTQSIPNFADVSLSAGADSVDADRWRIDVAQETGQPVEELTWSTPEGIDVRPLYSATDREGLGFVDSLPGISPFVRGRRFHPPATLFNISENSMLCYGRICRY